ncbi:IucA/IucC family protein [Streptomyces chumphonensis]|uniref:IucA/IucC family protein n=1 Tax=Streptomyces chumphonensis TaxID=1214925 RepID=UPI003D71A8C1
MNATAGSEESPDGDGAPVPQRLARLLDDPTVPRQARRAARPAPPEPSPTTDAAGPADDCLDAADDPLDAADVHRAADAAGAENLLRCWVRETGRAAPPPGRPLRVPLPGSGTALQVPVRYWSPTGWHRFGPVRLDSAPADAAPLDAVTLAGLLAREAAHQAGTPGESSDLSARVADSVRQTARFLAARRARPGPPAGADPFLAAEQALVFGHPAHPAPKSREGFGEEETEWYSPELHGSFPLHWFAVHHTALACDSAWTESGRARTAAELASRLAPDLPLPAGTVALPLHPWQARTVRGRPSVAALFDAGLLHDLGPHGGRWHPTSSIRTVARPGTSTMLKLSLAVRVTNSRRENLRKELHRGVEVHRLLRSGLGERWRAVHPCFDIVRDPAWLGVDDADGTPVPGLDTVFRHNPFRPDDDAVCLASLTSPRPWPDTAGHPTRSRLADVVRRLASATGRRTQAVAAEWFLRYLDAVVAPVLWLDAHAGIALEAHQQNTVVLLDPDGWPVGGRYRDNQGYYFRASHRAALQALVPGVGEESDSFVPDAVTDERFAYYLGINHVLGLIGAFGSQAGVDEALLLAAFRRFLDAHATRGGDVPTSPLAGLLLDAPSLRCKANLLTRLHGLDELVGPVDTQSVYVSVPNPLAVHPPQ